MTDFHHQSAKILKEGNVVRNSVAIRQHPLWIIEMEMNQTCHVIPSTKVQANDVILKVEKKLFHLKRQWMRFHQGHTLNEVLWPVQSVGQCLENITPPQRLFCRLRFRDVDG